MAAYIGLDPSRNIEWVTSDDATSMQLFVDGKIDAFLGVPPEPQELRDRQIGHTILPPPSMSRGRNTTAACWPLARNM
jgi:NitT/TauT family transport system substrate-binding protein